MDVKSAPKLSAFNRSKATWINKKSTHPPIYVLLYNKGNEKIQQQTKRVFNSKKRRIYCCVTPHKKELNFVGNLHNFPIMTTMSSTKTINFEWKNLLTFDLKVIFWTNFITSRIKNSQFTTYIRNSLIYSWSVEYTKKKLERSS